MTIRSRQDYREHLRRDAAAHGLERVRLGTLLTRPQLAFQRRMRAPEWATNCWTGPWGRAGAALLRYRMLRCGTRLGFTVPVNTTGTGLCLAHVGTVVVSRKARVGSDVRIHAGVDIGESDGRAAVVGDGCYLGLAPSSSAVSSSVPAASSELVPW